MPDAAGCKPSVLPDAARCNLCQNARHLRTGTGLGPYPYHIITTKTGGGGGVVRCKKKHKGKKDVIRTGQYNAHFVCRMLPDVSPLPDAAGCKEKFCRMLVESLLLTPPPHKHWTTPSLATTSQPLQRLSGLGMGMANETETPSMLLRPPLIISATTVAACHGQRSSSARRCTYLASSFCAS